MIAAASDNDTELFLFAGWLKKDLLPIDSDELARHDPITKGLHAQWERFKLIEGVIYRRYWEGREEDDTWQLVSPVDYREEIMQTAHAFVTGGHMGEIKRRSRSQNVRIGSGGREMCAIFAGGVVSTRNAIAVPLRSRVNFRTCA